MMWNAGADRDRADVHVTVIDVPAIGALGVAAAGESRACAIEVRAAPGWPYCKKEWPQRGGSR
jgi:hypothetical protein